MKPMKKEKLKLHSIYRYNKEKFESLVVQNKYKLRIGLSSANKSLVYDIQRALT